MSNRYMFMLLRYVALLYAIKSRFPTCKTPFSWKKTTNVDEDEKNKKKKGKREKRYIRNNKLSRNKDDLGWTRLRTNKLTTNKANFPSFRSHRSSFTETSEEKRFSNDERGPQYTSSNPLALYQNQGEKSHSDIHAVLSLTEISGSRIRIDLHAAKMYKHRLCQFRGQ